MQTYLNEAIEAVGCGYFQFALLCICGMAFISDAMEISLLTFITKDVQGDLKCSSLALSVLASVIFCGMFLGSVCFGPLSDYIGRRHTFLFCMLFVSVGGLLSSLSPNMYVFIATRALVGMGVGGLHVCVTLFTEFIPIKNRPLLFTLLQAFWAIGVVFESLLSWVLRDYSWRYLVLCTAFPAVLSTFSFFALPESPLFLFSKNRNTEAMQVFEHIAQINATQEKLSLLHSPPKTMHQQKPDSSFHGQWKTIFLKERYRLTLFCFLGLWFVGSFVYCGSLFIATDMSYGRWDRHLSLLLIGLGEVVGKIFPYYFLKYCSRKSSMYFSIYGCSLCVGILSLKSLFPDTVVLVAMLFYRITIAIYLTILSLYTPESFPTEIRSTGYGLSTSGSRIGGMLSPFVAIMVQSSHFSAGLAIFFAALQLSAIAVFLLPYDTANVSLACQPGQESP